MIWVTKKNFVTQINYLWYPYKKCIKKFVSWIGISSFSTQKLLTFYTPLRNIWRFIKCSFTILRFCQYVIFYIDNLFQWNFFVYDLYRINIKFLVTNFHYTFLTWHFKDPKHWKHLYDKSKICMGSYISSILKGCLKCKGCFAFFTNLWFV
jgi:hypothetical protein